MPDDTAPTSTTAAVTATQAPPAADAPDTRDPDAARQEQLHAAYEANGAAGMAPYEKVVIRALGELQWIVRERNWSVDYPLPEGKQHPDLRGADLFRANLSGAKLFGTNLSGAKLFMANLSGANLTSANLSGANLIRSNLSGTYLADATLSGADLTRSNLSGANLSGADLHGADLSSATLSGANLRLATLSGANLLSATLSGADLTRANLSGANLFIADLIGTRLLSADLSGAHLSGAHLSDANLTEVTMDRTTRLADVALDEKTRLLDIDWRYAALTRVKWPALLGDEQGVAKAKNLRERINAYHDAARSYRNLGIALHSQGLLIPASNYRLREQIMERKASFWSGNLLAWVFSWLLNVVAGYGERPARSLAAYLLIILSFAAAYLALGTGTLAGFGLGTPDAVNTPLAALVFSITSFHGRGFFPGSGFRLDEPIIVLAAAEALFGLFIEITFIATFTRRFFGSQ